MRNTPIIVTNIESGEEVVFATLRRVMAEYRVSDNKLYRLLYSGNAEKLFHSRTGKMVTVRLRYRDASKRMVIIRDNEGSCNERKRYRPE